MPNCMTTNGKRSTHICNTIPGLMRAKMPNAGSSLKPSCGSCAAELNGVCFPKNTVTGTASTSVLPVGATTRYGKICINISPMIRIWRISCWTARLYEHILVPLELQKKWRAGKPGARTQPGRLQHQDPRQLRCPGQSAAVSPDGRTAT